jgi:hypothetical protein
LHARECGPQARELVGAPDERRGSAEAQADALLGEAQDPERLDATQRGTCIEGLHAVGGDRTVDERAGRLAEERLAGEGRLLEPRSQDDSAPRCEGLTRARVGGKHFPGVDADADPQLDIVTDVQRGNGLVQLDRGPDGAKSVVLVDLGDAEDRHRRVADELLHGSAVLRDDALDHLEVGPHDAAEDLGVELGSERRRVDDIGEQNRDRLAAVGLPPTPRGGTLELERGIVAQDRLLEALELRGRLDPELLDQRVACSAIGLERVGLPAGPVQREHQLAPRPLAQWVLAHECLQLGDERTVVSELELRLEQLLASGGAKLFEARNLGLRERLERELGERRPTPERQCLAEHSRPSFGRAFWRLPDEPLEAVGVDVVPIDGEYVPRRTRHQQLGAERLAQLGDEVLKRTDGGLGGRRAPELLDETVGRDHLAGSQRE